MNFSHSPRGGKRLILAALIASASVIANAEEGGSGHYQPGAMASFMDGVAPTGTLLLRYNLVSYNGSLHANRPLPIGGLATANADVSVLANGLTFFWSPPIKLGDSGKWTYAMTATLPVVSLDVSADVTSTLPGGMSGPSQHIADSISGIGDILLQPLMLNYNASPDLNVNMRMSLYLPTGSYKAGRLANAGKNYWSYEPTIGLIYWNRKTNLEADWFSGVTFNTRNKDTDYKSGAQFHSEATVAQHFPTKVGVFGAGGGAYYYRQISGDSGSGANYGSFESRIAGIGPVASYVTRIGGHDLTAEFKWLREFAAERRPEGNTVFLKVIYKLQQP